MKPAPIVVAGHLCLDIIPAFTEAKTGDRLIEFGKLLDVGPAAFSIGGVANTAVDLCRLHQPPGLVALVGQDAWAGLLRERLNAIEPAPRLWLGVRADVPSSYSIVISPPGVDRIFFHCRGVNDVFSAADIPEEALGDARIVHVGYPTLMAGMYRDTGAGLDAVLRRIRAAGCVTSVDPSRPDPESESGRADWAAILERTLPLTDLFHPSFEELLFMLERDTYEHMAREGGEGEMAHRATHELLDRLTGRLLDMGCAVVGLKLGDQGLYLRTTSDPDRLPKGEHFDPDRWLGRRLWTPCFASTFVGTTGSGDATIAGLLGAIAAGRTPEAAVLDAVAVGAFSTEAADASSGIRDWDTVRGRVARGWKRLPVRIPVDGWMWDESAGLWRAPDDAGANV